MTRRRLTTKQALFVEHYLGDAFFNATEAAKRAGYKGRRSTLGQVGHENLKKPEIKRRITERLNAAGMTAEECLARLTRQARGDIGQFITEDGSIDLKAIKEVGSTDLIKTISDTDKGTRIDLYSAQDALKLIGQSYGLFRERVEHKVEHRYPDFDEALRRAYGDDDKADDQTVHE
jgi:phage terminase small subunit